MAQIKNLDDLRQDAINTLEKLANGQIDCDQAGVTAKLYESVMSTVKTQLQVAVMLKREPNIPFLGDCTKQKTFDGKPNLALESEKS